VTEKNIAWAKDHLKTRYNTAVGPDKVHYREISEIENGVLYQVPDVAKIEKRKQTGTRRMDFGAYNSDKMPLFAGHRFWISMCRILSFEGTSA
jgi:hypothetical protein